MSKKTFYIILAILAGLLVIGGLIWYFFFRSSAPATAPQSAGFTSPGQAVVSEILVPISDGPVIAAHFNGDNFLFYDFSGWFWRVSGGDLRPAQVTQPAIEKPADIIWSSTEKNIIKTGLNQSDIRYVFSDFGETILTNLKSGIKSAAFSPDAKKIAYYFSDPKNNSLFISDPDGKNQKTLIGGFKLRDVVLEWPKTGQIAAISKPSGLAPGGLWLFDINNSKLTKVIDSLPGLEVVFSPKGDEFIYSYVDQGGQNPILVVYRNGISKSINNISTLVDKCAWADDSINIYCAIPKSWPGSAILPDDYYKGAFSTNDDVWKINTETGEKNIIFENMGDASNLAPSSGEESLIFILKNSGFLYKLNLK